MIYEIPKTIENVGFVGDIHGAFEDITYKIINYNIRNTCFLFCGDVGLGFYKYDYYKNLFKKISKKLNKYNNIFLFVRGNHEDPAYYRECKISLNRIKSLPDYSIVKAGSQNILVVGGGISIDRVNRRLYNNNLMLNYMRYHNCSIDDAKAKCNKIYWEDEQIIYQPKVDCRIDIICSHSSPSFCYPIDKGPIVNEFASKDDLLLRDLNIERSLLDKVYNDYSDSIVEWYYGHFHFSKTEIINNTKFRLLDINELFYKPII